MARRSLLSNLPLVTGEAPVPSGAGGERRDAGHPPEPSKRQARAPPFHREAPLPIDALIAAGHVAHDIEGALRAIQPDTSLARVRVRALGGPRDLVLRVVLYTGRGVRYTTPDGIGARMGEYARWDDLSPEEAPRYLAWLRAGNAGFPSEWRAFAADPAAEWCPEPEPAGIFGKSGDAPR